MQSPSFSFRDSKIKLFSWFKKFIKHSQINPFQSIASQIFWHKDDLITTRSVCVIYPVVFITPAFANTDIQETERISRIMFRDIAFAPRFQ